MKEHNPFQPPAAPRTTVPIDGPPPLSESELDDARRRLRAHTRDPSALAADKSMAGGLLTLRTIIAAIICLAFAAASLFVIQQANSDVSPWLILAGVGSGVSAILAVAFLVNDLLVGQRSAATQPKMALVRWFRAARTGRNGYAIAALAPSARESMVSAPTYGPKDTSPVQSYLVSTPAQMKAYLGTFARPSGPWVRWMRLKKLEVVSQQDDIAVVRGQISLTKWPQWANVLSVVLFVSIRILGIIAALVLYYGLQRSTTIDIEKTLLRGDDGLWYLADADVRR